MSDTAIHIIIGSVAGLALLLLIIHILTKTTFGANVIDAFEYIIDAIVFIFKCLFKPIAWIIDLFDDLFYWIREKREEREELKRKEKARAKRREYMERKKREKEEKLREEKDRLLEESKADVNSTKQYL